MKFHYTNLNISSMGQGMTEEEKQELLNRAITKAKEAAKGEITNNVTVQQTISSAITEKVESIDNIATVVTNPETGESEGKFVNEALDSNYDNINNYSTKEVFPESGKKDTLYIDNNTGSAYIWDDDAREYVNTSGESLSDEEINSIFY